VFTGIIEDVGTVKSIEKRGSSGRITVETSLDTSAFNVGDSVAVNGACLTLTSVKRGSFTADISEETLNVTTLGGLGPGASVNLEPALTLSKPLGGHMVTGHVDATGRIKSLVNRAGYIDLTVECPEALMKQVVRKGSVSVDGISLTVASMTKDTFSVAVIPHTVERTTLGDKREGTAVNIETDVIGKYVERFMKGVNCSITEDFLSEHGFKD